MSKIDPLQASFNAGELSPRLHARVDFVKYPSGLEECQNLIPLPEGGLTRRPGTRFVAEVVDSAVKGRLFAFEATAEQHHVLELGENKIRFFFRQGQQVVLDTDAVITNGNFLSGFTDWDDRSTGGGSITHDATNDRLNLIPGGTAGSDIGWAEQDVTTTDLNQEHVIKFEVIGDPGDKIQFQVGSTTTGSETLSPVGKLVGFHCVAFTPTTSPFYIQFRNLGSNDNKTIQIDNVSIIDDSALEIDSPYIEEQLFQISGAQSNDVKYLFRSGVAPYKLERRSLSTWSLIRVAWQDGPYITQNSELTTLSPAATSGVAVTVTASSIIGINGGQGFLLTDVGRLVRIDNGAEWGWGIIVTFTSTTIVNVHVKKDFATTDATATWRLGAWSHTTGWPKVAGFFEQRLYVASTNDQSQTLWGSQTGDFENYKPDDDNNVIEADDALNFTLSSDSVNEIRWMSAGQDTLAIGTAGGEWVPSAAGIVITPLDITIRRQTTHGSSLVAPLRVDHVVLFVQKARRKIREFVFNFEIDSFLAPDLTRLAQHITAPSINEMAFQQEPDSLVWIIRSDGIMASLTFRRDEDVVGWARHDIGGSGSEGILASFQITGGSVSQGVNQITSITVDGVEILTGPVDYIAGNIATAEAIVSSINRVSTSDIVYDNVELDLGSEPIALGGIAISSDGTKIYALNISGTEGVFQYNLTTPFLLETASYSGVFKDTSVVNDQPQAIAFSSDGSKMYIAGNFFDGNNSFAFIDQWNLSLPWKLSTATYSQQSPNLWPVIKGPQSLAFSPDGRTLFILEDFACDCIHQYTLASPWNISTLFATGKDTFDPTPENTILADITFNRDGSKLLLAGRSGDDSVFEYHLSTAYDVESMSYSGIFTDVSGIVATTNSLVAVALSADGSKMYIGGQTSFGPGNINKIHQFTLNPVLYTAILGTNDNGSPSNTVIIEGTGASNGFSVVVTTSGDVTVDPSTTTIESSGISLSNSIVSISGFDGVGQVQNSEDRDEIWILVERIIDGETKRYVEFFEGYYDNLLHDQEDAYYSDSIITYDGALTNTITGLSHLEGETVKVWGDGATLPDVVVSDGEITLETFVMVAQIGLPYKHRLKTLKIEGGNPAGTAMGKKKRINGVTFVLLNSHTLTFGPDDDNKFEKDFRLVSSPMDAEVPLFTGEQFYEFDGGLTPDARIIVESDDPAPFTLLAMIPEVKVLPSK